jgi:hypothetical protein
MGTLIEDARKAAEWVSQALTSSGYTADFSPESLREIDRFFDEHSRGGQAVPGGLLSEDRGQRLFALGAYVGEVVLRQYGGRWEADDEDPDGEINLRVVLPGGAGLTSVE